MKLSRPVEILLIILVWYGVRIAMITTGVTFIHIPVVDESIRWIFSLFADQGAVHLWWIRTKYRVMH